MKPSTQANIEVVQLPSNNPKVKEILNDWAKDEDVEEIVIMGKIRGGEFRWQHSRIGSTFYWLGFFNYMASMLADWQKGG